MDQTTESRINNIIWEALRKTRTANGQNLSMIERDIITTIREATWPRGMMNKIVERVCSHTRISKRTFYKVRRLPQRHPLGDLEALQRCLKRCRVRTKQDTETVLNAIDENNDLSNWALRKIIRMKHGINIKRESFRLLRHHCAKKRVQR